MPPSEPASVSTEISLIHKTDRVDAPTLYPTWRDYAFSDMADPQGLPASPTNPASLTGPAPMQN